MKNLLEEINKVLNEDYPDVGKDSSFSIESNGPLYDVVGDTTNHVYNSFSSEGEAEDEIQNLEKGLQEDDYTLENEMKDTVYGDIDRENISDTEGLEDLYNYYREENEEAANYIDDNYDEILEYIENGGLDG